MRSYRPHIALLAFLVILSAACSAANAQTEGCSAVAFEKDAAATLASCTTLLKSDLATADKAQTFKIRARAAHRLGRLEEAISDYETALKLTPDDPELYLRRGWTYYDQYEHEAAYKYAAHALSLDANRDEAYDLAGAVMMRLGDPVRAKAMYDDAVRLQPHNLWARFHRYQLFETTRKFPEALAELDGILDLPIAVTRAASLKYSDRSVTFRTSAGLHRATTLNALGRTAEASFAYDQVVNEDPSALTFALRGMNRRIANQHRAGTVPESEIQADVDKAIVLDPKYWRPRDLQARVYISAKRYDAAAAEYARAIQLAPDRGDLRWSRSLVLRQAGRVEEATNEALAIIDVDPNYILNEKAQSLHRRGYLQPVSGRDGLAALRDAMQACMLDERCY